MVDGEGLVAGVERGGGLGEGVAGEDEAAFGGAFFLGEPEDGGLLGGHAGEGGAGGDAEGELGGEAGLAGLGRAGEEDEVALGDPALDEPSGLGGREVVDGVEEVFQVVVSFSSSVGPGYGIEEFFFGHSGNSALVDVCVNLSTPNARLAGQSKAPADHTGFAVHPALMLWPAGLPFCQHEVLPWYSSGQ